MENINNILDDLKIKATCVNVSQFKHHKFYDLKLSGDYRVRQLQSKASEISLRLRSKTTPIIEPIFETGLVRIRTVVGSQKTISLSDLPKPDIEKITMVLGESETGEPVYCDFDDNPHMIVAGATGSGKSTMLHTMIANLLNYDLDLYLVDPKHGVEFSRYDNVAKQIVCDYSDTIFMLEHLYEKMEDRFINFSMGKRKKIVLVIDEVADLMMQDDDNEFHKLLISLAQKCRTANMNIVIATQRPSCDVITGTIKANFPARIACKTATSTESRIVLDRDGAEHLIGNGDAIIHNNRYNYTRFQGALSKGI